MRGEGNPGREHYTAPATRRQAGAGQRTWPVTRDIRPCGGVGLTGMAGAYVIDCDTLHTSIGAFGSLRG